VLEIQGPPSSGKTHLLYHLLITCILPSSYLSANIGGWGKAAVVFDTDATFDVLRVNQLILSRLQHLFSSDPSTTPDSAKELARISLERLHIFRSTSSIQLAVTITHLPAYHSTHMPDTEIGLLAIDSISAFYWPDRFAVEQLRSAPSTAEPGKQAQNIANALQHVLTALQKFRCTYSPVIALTNWGLTPLAKPSSASTPVTFYRQHLHPFPSPFAPPEPWTSMPTNPLPLTHHITIPFIAIHPLNQDVSLEQLKAQEQHQNELGEVVGIIRTTGSTAVGRFALRIGDAEISIG
jgi:DNA-repair protein XRCC2